MIEAWAERLAIRIKGLNSEETVSVPVMKFALIIIINFLIPYLASYLIGFLTGKFIETIVAVHAFVLVRAISGGYHFRSSMACTIVSILVITIPPHIFISTEWVVLLTGISLLIFAIFAPANIKGYARMPEKYFPIMKLASVCVVASNFFFESSILSIIFFIQAISLLVPNKKEVRS